MQDIKDIIGDEQSSNPHKQFDNLLDIGEDNHNNIEQMMLDYGLEMDYIEQLS